MSLTDFTYHGTVSRWEPNARGRLEQAALDLYVEHGFEQTTVAEIAQKAHLTERTFFRHFADKREVLFSGSGDLHELLVSAVTNAPASYAPIDVVAGALGRAGELLGQHRQWSRSRQLVIEANVELKERELIKLATLATAMADALRERGVPSESASLAAEAGVAAFRIGFERWTREDDPASLTELIDETLARLKDVAAGE